MLLSQVPVALYSNWYEDPKTAKIVWIYGDEISLKQDSLDLIKSSLCLNEFNYITIDAALSQESDIWNAVYHTSLLDTSGRCVVVLNAHKLQNIGTLEEWISQHSRNSDTKLVLVADSDPISSKIRSPKATLIKCAMPKAENKLQWLKFKSELSLNSCKSILEFTNGNLQDAKILVDKLKRVAGSELSVTRGMLEAISVETDSDFLDALMSKDKVRAYKAISKSDIVKVLTFLSYNMRMLNEMKHVLKVTPTGSAAEHVKSLPGFPMGKLPEFLKLQKLYSFKDITRQLQLLAMLESSAKQGASEGVLEALVTLW